MTQAEVKIRHLEHQSERWKRDPAFMEEENIALKNRVGEIVSSSHVTPDFLEKLEANQNQFIAKDQTVRQILLEVKNWDKLLVKDRYLDGRENNGKLVELQRNLPAPLNSL
jgi:hypothetical protein